MIEVLIVALCLGVAALLIIITRRLQRSLEEKDQERMKAFVKETTDLDEEVLGRIRVLKLPKFSPLGEMPLIHEVLVVTANNVFVERIAEEKTPSVPGSSIIVDDVYRYLKRRRKSGVDKSFAIPNSDITRVWLKKFGWRGRKVKLNIITAGKEYEWVGNGLLLPDGWKTDGKLEDYKNILQQAFPDKLSVRK